MPGKYWRFGDRYAGLTSRGKRFVVDTASQAKAKAGLATGASKKRTTKTTRRRKSVARRRRTKKKSTRRSGRILGTMGLKGLIFGTGMVIGGEMLTSRLGIGGFGPAGSLVAAGLISKVTKLPGASLLPAGIILLLSQMAKGMIGLGGNAGAARGGYDY